MVIKAKCEEMCPEDETNMRYKAGLLHVFEVKKGTESLRKPLPDRVVKSFSRSAAGKQIRSKDIRTPEALLKTVNYLFYEILIMDKLPWHKTYDFIADRLLAVRQDMVIQECPRHYRVSLLQPMVKFYAYASYRLCDRPIEEFDPTLNSANLRECLKQLLLGYDDFDSTLRRLEVLRPTGFEVGTLEALYGDCREFFEALYVLVNLGDRNSIVRALSLPDKWRSKGSIRVGLGIAICYSNGNWVRVCRMIGKLPKFLAAVVSLHLAEIRRKALKKMSVAYSSKNLTFPISQLQADLLYSTRSDVIKDCEHYGIKCTKEEVQFNKSEFNNTIKMMQLKKEKFAIEKLRGIEPSAIILDPKLF